MPRTLTARRPNSTEVRRLLQGLEADDLTTAQRRRAEVLLLYAQGWTPLKSPPASRFTPTPFI